MGDEYIEAIGRIERELDEVGAALGDALGDDAGTDGGDDPISDATRARFGCAPDDVDEGLDAAFGVSFAKPPATMEEALDRIMGTDTHAPTDDEALDRAFGIGAGDRERRQADNSMRFFTREVA